MSITHSLTGLSAAALLAFAISFAPPAMAAMGGNSQGLQGINLQGDQVQGIVLQGDENQGEENQGQEGQGVFLQGVSTKALADYPRGFEIIGIELPD